MGALTTFLVLHLSATAWADPGRMDEADEGTNPYFEELLELRERGDVPNFIVNGETTLDFPQVVALGTDVYGGFEVFCSGTLIHPRWILTAAHCLDNVEGTFGPVSKLQVAFGGAVTSGDTRLVYWEDYFIHPSYQSNVFANDIGLIKLAGSMPDIEPMVVNDEMPDETWVDTDLTFVGFGITTDNGGDSGTKRKTKITVTDSDDQYIYSYSPGTNVCNGDSGGAALEKTPDGWEVSGINAYVTPGCVGGSNAATNVAAFLDFVTEHVTPNFEPPEPDLGGDGGLGLGVARDLDGNPFLGERAGSGAQLGCSTTSGSPSGWFVLLGLLLMRRATRRDS